MGVEARCMKIIRRRDRRHSLDGCPEKAEYPLAEYPLAEDQLTEDQLAVAEILCPLRDTVFRTVRVVSRAGQWNVKSWGPTTSRRLLIGGVRPGALVQRILRERGVGRNTLSELMLSSSRSARRNKL